MNERSAERRNFTAEERASIISRFRSSGLTQRQFAKEQGLNLTTFQSWLYAKGAKPKAKRAFKFQEFKVAAGPVSSGWAAEIAWADGMTVRVSSGVSAAWLSAVVKQLSKPC